MLAGLWELESFTSKATRMRQRGSPAAPPIPRGRHSNTAVAKIPPPGQLKSNRRRIRAFTCTAMARPRGAGGLKDRAAHTAACAAREPPPPPSGPKKGARPGCRQGPSSGCWFWNWVKQKRAESPMGLRSMHMHTCTCLLLASLPATFRLIFASMRAPVSPSWIRHMARVHGNTAPDSLRSQLSTRGNSGDYSS